MSIEKVKSKLSMITRNGKGLLHLINQMLDLSKIEVGKMSLDLSRGDIVSYIKYLLESFYSLTESKKIKVHFISDFELLELDYDKEKMNHVVSNLLSNAIKFTPEGGHIYISIFKRQ